MIGISKIRLIILISILSILSVELFQGISFAVENDSLYNYQPLGNITENDIAKGKEKANDAMVLMNLRKNYFEGKLSYQQYLEQVEKYEKKYCLSNIFKKSQLIPTFSLSSDKKIMTKLSNSGDGQDYSLTYPVYSQDNSYYCGPASCQIACKGYRGEYCAQSYYASDDNLQTDKNKQTPFGNNWTNTLKSELGVDYQLLNGASYGSDWAVTMTNSAITTILSGAAVILDTVQSGNDRLEGYSNNGKTMYHYLCGEGFNSLDTSNRKLKYIDPNGSNPNAFGRRTCTARLMGTVTKPRGIVF